MSDHFQIKRLIEVGHLFVTAHRKLPNATVDRLRRVFGDSATRATLYFLQRYPGEIKSTASEYTPHCIQALLQWHQDYLVSDYESHLNQVIFALQGNRNPLVDDSNLASRIDLTAGLR